ncbi:hypothetical protein RJ639_042084 [Escallonia herrerae]|uniref:cysteine desulfurase n=1 Tax=Escallonia herrerae TaxID=1293975 RepID=A0AA89B4H4_9ASTE|nr:hypothetical protein RJ639_042084 [Escallonia herrerae]
MTTTMAMGGVKLPSLSPINLNSATLSPSSSSVRFRPVSSSAAAAPSPIVSHTQDDPRLGSVPSLGHISRPDFPILHQEVNGSKLVYLDNAATSQKPAAVLNAIQKYYESYNSNVHRGVHFLSAKATDEYELARKKVATFINASESREVVFTRNATEAINLVAYSWGVSNLRPHDEVLLTIAEHHSAIVPWQLVAQKTGATLRFVDLDENEVPDAAKLREMLSRKTKLVVIHHVSNMLASVLPVEDVVLWAHNVGAKVLIGACQSVPHMVVDVKKLDADFLVASSHKTCGPTGVGFLYGKSQLLSDMPLVSMSTVSNDILFHDLILELLPFVFILKPGGGEMIFDVFLDHSTYAEPPSRLVSCFLLDWIWYMRSFCSPLPTHFPTYIHFTLNYLHLHVFVACISHPCQRTPAIGEAIGLGAAVDYLSGIGMQKIHDYEASFIYLCCAYSQYFCLGCLVISSAKGLVEEVFGGSLLLSLIVELTNYPYENLQSVPSVRIYGPSPSETVTRAALCSFNVDDIHPTDIATFLDQQHVVAIRSGHHCAQPLHRHLGINASARASLYFYNTKEDVNYFIEVLKDTISFFSSFK